MNSQIISHWKYLFIVFVVIGFSMMNINLASPNFFEATIYCDLSVQPTIHRSVIGTFSVSGDRSMDLTGMMPTINGWRSKDISYSWENIRLFYNLRSLAVWEYNEYAQSTNDRVYVAIIPTDMIEVDVLHPFKYCFNMQGFKIISENTTDLKIPRRTGTENVDFHLTINLWKLESETQPNRNWIVAFWYIFLSTGYQTTDRVYIVQIAHYVEGNSTDRAIGNTLLFIQETLSSVTGCLTETI